jgi:hypothetical protein
MSLLTDWLIVNLEDLGARACACSDCSAWPSYLVMAMAHRCILTSAHAKVHLHATLLLGLLFVLKQY